MFTMLRFFLIAAFLYIIFRIIQVTVRILSSRSSEDDAPGGDHAPLEMKEPERFEDIRDADFEDLPASKQKGGSEKEGGAHAPPAP